MKREFPGFYNKIFTSSIYPVNVGVSERGEVNLAIHGPLISFLEVVRCESLPGRFSGFAAIMACGECYDWD